MQHPFETDRRYYLYADIKLWFENRLGECSFQQSRTKANYRDQKVIFCIFQLMKWRFEIPEQTIDAGPNYAKIYEQLLNSPVLCRNLVT